MIKTYDTIRETIANERVFTNEPLSLHTSFGIGGMADILVMPESVEEIKQIIDICRRNETAYLIMGNGSNLLVRDGGIRAVVIKINKYFSRIRLNDEEIEADAGILLSSLSKFALENKLTGIEFMEGIPGTLGGAVCMNAGAYGSEIKDVLLSADVLTDNGDIIRLNNDELNFGYRQSTVQKKCYIALSAILSLKAGDSDKIQQKMNEYRANRKEKQPLDMPSAGSVFKRPEGYFAGKLISDSGLKGFSIGGAQVSEKHAGFIVNKSGASAADVIALIEHIKTTVYEKYGVLLEPEIRIIGEG